MTQEKKASVRTPEEASTKVKAKARLTLTHAPHVIPTGRKKKKKHNNRKSLLSIERGEKRGETETTAFPFSFINCSFVFSFLFFLAALEEQHGDLTKVEVQEAVSVMGHEAAKVAADDAVPRGLVLFIELLLDVGSNILLNVEFLHRLQRHLNRIRLHVLRHVGVLDGGLVVVIVHRR